MRIAFYTPFKPLDHPHPSGDQAIARALAEFLREQGHELISVGGLRTRWIYWRPHRWPRLLRDGLAARRQVHGSDTDLWLTYHCYYKAPDLLGPLVSRAAGLPYVVFQGVYATKYRRRLATWPGFRLNRWCLRRADHIFTNKRVDRVNLERIVPGHRVTYIAPGIRPEEFDFDSRSRQRLRRQWGAGDTPVILAAAMFRDDVKTESLLWLIRACARLHRGDDPFMLVIAGDGPCRSSIQGLAQRELGDRCRLVGRIPRRKMAGFYSAGDIFAYPGIGEALGMVYLEAQACGLPVVAFDNGGIAEVVDRRRTGFLTPVREPAPYVRALRRLIQQPALRREMGNSAVRHVRRHHDLNRNYSGLSEMLRRVARRQDIAPTERCR